MKCIYKPLVYPFYLWWSNMQYFIHWAHTLDGQNEYMWYSESVGCNWIAKIHLLILYTLAASKEVIDTMNIGDRIEISSSYYSLKYADCSGMSIFTLCLLQSSQSSSPLCSHAGKQATHANEYCNICGKQRQYMYYCEDYDGLIQLMLYVCSLSCSYLPHLLSFCIEIPLILA